MTTVLRFVVALIAALVGVILGVLVIAAAIFVQLLPIALATGAVVGTLALLGVL